MKLSNRKRLPSQVDANGQIIMLIQYDDMLSHHQPFRKNVKNKQYEDLLVPLSSSSSTVIDLQTNPISSFLQGILPMLPGLSSL